jgi:hypothetical protein
MRITALGAAWVVLAAASAAAQGGSGFSRPLGQGLRGGGGLKACAPRPADGPCDLRDYEEAFVVPSAVWGDAIEGSGCDQSRKAALSAKLESASAAFNAGVLMTRKALGDQTAAQEGVACVRSAADESRYAAKQRAIFTSRWQDEVRSWLAQCPPPPKEAPKAKRRGERRAPACRFRGYDDGVSGGCETIPKLPRTDEDYGATMVHASVQSCPEKTRTMTRVRAGARLGNFKMAETFNQWAANSFMEAQAGVRCDDVLAAYRDYAETASGTFHAAWLEYTAASGAACRGGGGD